MFQKNHNTHYYNQICAERNRKEQTKLAEAFAKALAVKEPYVKMRVRIEMMASEKDKAGRFYKKP